MSAKQLTRMALLTGIALVIFVLEAQIPAPVPVPGVKLGLANIVTVYAVFTMPLGSAFTVLLGRILLGSFFAGQGVSLIYSLSGGVLCFVAMAGIKRILTLRQIWVCSVIGAVCHNIGQILAAIIITRTPAVAAYLPVLVVSGIITGLFTGLAAQFLIGRLNGVKM